MRGTGRSDPANAKIQEEKASRTARALPARTGFFRLIDGHRRVADAIANGRAVDVFVEFFKYLLFIHIKGKHMICRNDLYDISFALTSIRSNIYYELNNVVLQKIEGVLKSDKQVLEPNQIRNAISSIQDLDRERWHLVYHNNLYANYRLIKDDNIYLVLLNSVGALKRLIQNHEFAQAFDLADCIHALPEILADNNISIPKSFWKTYIKKYRKKWNRSFLKDEEKALRKAMRRRRK